MVIKLISLTHKKQKCWRGCGRDNIVPGKTLNVGHLAPKEKLLRDGSSSMTFYGWVMNDNFTLRGLSTHIKHGFTLSGFETGKARLKLVSPLNSYHLNNYALPSPILSFITSSVNFNMALNYQWKASVSKKSIPVWNSENSRHFKDRAPNFKVLQESPEKRHCRSESKHTFGGNITITSSIKNLTAIKNFKTISTF